MNKYIVKAWLPGLPYFIATDAAGTTGLLTEEGFSRRPEHFLRSAVTKGGYVPLENEPEIAGDEASVKKLEEQLKRLLD
mgnify:FL=1